MKLFFVSENIKNVNYQLIPVINVNWFVDRAETMENAVRPAHAMRTRGSILVNSSAQEIRKRIVAGQQRSAPSCSAKHCVEGRHGTSDVRHFLISHRRPVADDLIVGPGCSLQ